MQKHAKRQVNDNFKNDAFISDVFHRCLCVISGQTEMAKEIEYSPRSAVSLKLTADQVLVSDWIARSTQVNSPKHISQASFSRVFCGSTRLHGNTT